MIFFMCWTRYVYEWCTCCDWYVFLKVIYRAVFKWLSKVIKWLRLLRLVIGSKDSRQFFNQWEAKPKPIAPCTRDFSRALSELQVIARNCDWFISLAAPVVIGRSNCLCFGFSTVIWKPLYTLFFLIIKGILSGNYIFPFRKSKQLFNLKFSTGLNEMGRVMRKGPGRHILSIFSFKLFCPLHR